MTPERGAARILNQAGLRVVTVPGHASGTQTGAVVGTDPPFGSTVEFGRGQPGRGGSWVTPTIHRRPPGPR